MKGVAPDREAENESRALAMWAQYSNGASLREVGRAFSTQPTSVGDVFKRRGWKRRTLSEAHRLLGTGAGHQRLLAALLRVRVACEAFECQPADIDLTLFAMPEEDQARLRGLARRDLVELLTNPSHQDPSHE